MTREMSSRSNLMLNQPNDREMVEVRTGNQTSKAILITGLALLILAGYTPTMTTDYYVLNFITGGAGLFLIIVYVGNLLMKEEMDRKASVLHSSGFILVGIGLVVLLNTQLAINAHLPSWWVFPLIGGALFVAGTLFVLWSWIYRKRQTN